MARARLLEIGITNLVRIGLLLLAVAITSPVFEKQENPPIPATLQKR